MSRGTYIPEPKDKELEKTKVTKYLEKKFGEGFEYTRYDDNGKYIDVEMDYGDDEVLTVLLSRRAGDNGSYRVVTQGAK